MSGRIIAYGRPNGDFTMLRNEFVRRSDIGPTAFRVAVYVMSHQSGFHLDQGSIGRAIGMHGKTVGRAFAELEELGLLIRVRCADEKGHRVADDLYISQTTITPEQRESLGDKSLRRDFPGRDLGEPKEDQFNKKINKELLSTEVDDTDRPGDEERQDEAEGALFAVGSPSVRASLPEGFEQFWATYPRKVSKKAAMIKYRAALKAKHAPEVILAGLERSIQQWRREQRADEYVPHAATWLNQERFLDGQEAVAAAREQAGQDELVASDPVVWLRGEYMASRVDLVHQYYRGVYLPPEIDIEVHGKLNLEQYQERLVKPYNREWILKNKDRILSAIAAKTQGASA